MTKEIENMGVQLYPYEGLLWMLSHDTKAKFASTMISEENIFENPKRRKEIKLMETLFKAGGAALNDAGLSASTIHYKRKQKVQTHAIEIRDYFASFK